MRLMTGPQLSSARRPRDRLMSSTTTTAPTAAATIHRTVARADEPDSPAKDGGPFYTFQTDSYRLVHPVAATTAAGESGSSALATVPSIVAAAVGAVVVVLLIKRSRGRRAEES